MAVTQLSQKEYLKKYLSNPDDKRKKKKKKKPTTNSLERFRVVDDDIDLKNMRPIEDGEIDLYNLAEDAPQIAGIIDERPDEMRTLEEFRGSKRWKIMSDENGDNDIKIISIENTNKHQDKVAKLPDSKPSSSKKHDDSDTSPPRKSRSQSDLDNSPRKSQKSDSDHSPPRNSKKQETSSRRRDSDSDASPPRKTVKHYVSPSGKDDSKSSRRRSFSPRRNRSKSPPARRRNKKSPPHNGHGRSNSPTKLRGRMEKTLDGKRAGLQDARELREEISNFKKRDDEFFAKMGDKISGKGAETVVRDRKTGKRRNLEEDAKQREEQEKKLSIHKEKYSRWGKGLKQIEEQKENLQQALHEMSKPLARYADDDDLEKHLRDQEREGDPMLEYIRSKKTDDSTK
ncbi:hypothetical protein L9F63_008134, partial [Diploptera punctata]